MKSKNQVYIAKLACEGHELSTEDIKNLINDIPAYDIKLFPQCIESPLDNAEVVGKKSRWHKTPPPQTTFKELPQRIDAQKAQENVERILTRKSIIVDLFRIYENICGISKSYSNIDEYYEDKYQEIADLDMNHSLELNVEHRYLGILLIKKVAAEEWIDKAIKNQYNSEQAVNEDSQTPLIDPQQINKVIKDKIKTAKNLNSDDHKYLTVVIDVHEGMEFGNAYRKAKTNASTKRNDNASKQGRKYYENGLKVAIEKLGIKLDYDSLTMPKRQSPKHLPTPAQKRPLQ